MSEETLIDILTGPVAALALCLMAIYGIGKWLATHLPKWVDRHLNQIDDIVKSHDQDRETYKESLGTITTSLKDLKGEVDVIKDDVKDIKRIVKDPK